MTKCPICGREYDDNTSFCTDCGVKLNHEQPTYAPAGEGGAAPTGSSEPLSMGSFMLMELVARVPILNIVMMFIWSFSGDTNINRKNWARARLIWVAIGLVVSVLAIAAALVLGGALSTVIAEATASY